MLSGGEDPGDRAAPAVTSQVNLGAQPAAGAAQGLPARPGRRILVIRRGRRSPSKRAWAFIFATNAGCDPASQRASIQATPRTD